MVGRLVGLTPKYTIPYMPIKKFTSLVGTLSYTDNNKKQYNHDKT